MKLLKLLALSSLILSLAACAPAVSGAVNNPIALPLAQSLALDVDQTVYLKANVSAYSAGMSVEDTDKVSGLDFSYDQVVEGATKTAALDAKDFQLAGFLDGILSEKSGLNPKWVLGIQSITITRKLNNVVSKSNEKSWRNADSLNVIFSFRSPAPTTEKDKTVILQLKYKTGGLGFITFPVNIGPDSNRVIPPSKIS